MKLSMSPGKYVIAISGGVDSVSLLHILQALPGLDLTVAHLDHGIRQDSGEDRKFVESLARTYGLPFYFEEGKLGSAASEAMARQARYAFLRKVQMKVGAKAIITAHHQDDVLETAVINLLRGTGRRGLSALRSHQDVERPLLNIPKVEIVQYARENELEWREDSTNSQEKYLRNYIRRRIIARLDEASRAKLLGLITDSQYNNEAIDTLLVKYFSTEANKIDRRQFTGLSHETAKEVMATWLREHQLRDFDSRTLERLVVSGKTARPGSQFDIRRSVKLRVNQDNLALVGLER